MCCYHVHVLKFSQSVNPKTNNVRGNIDTYVTLVNKTENCKSHLKPLHQDTNLPKATMIAEYLDDRLDLEENIIILIYSSINDICLVL